MKVQARWRAVSPADIDAVHAVSRIVHPTLPETRSVFANRLDLYSRGMRVLDVDGAVSGYCVAHPWRRDVPLPLDSLIEQLPDAPDTYYVHDLALLPRARGQGFARPVIEHIRAEALNEGLPEISLIAVGGSAPFWERFGFREAKAERGKLAGYGVDAWFLTLALRF